MIWFLLVGLYIFIAGAIASLTYNWHYENNSWESEGYKREAAFFRTFMTGLFWPLVVTLVLGAKTGKYLKEAYFE